MDEVQNRNTQNIKEYYDNLFHDSMNRIKENVEDQIDEVYGIKGKTQAYHELNMAIANIERARLQIKKEFIECLT